MSRRSTSPRHAIDISEEDGARYLHFGSDWVQGAMRIARPWSLELEYTRDMMAGLLLQDSTQWPKKILLIGLGAGSLTKFLYRNLPECRMTVIEINPQVEFVARQYFKLPDDPRRLDVITGCGADYVQESKKNFDWILVDGFDPDAKTGPLDTLQFYLACRSRLNAGGLFVTNLLGRSKGFKESVARINEAFDKQVAVLPPCLSGNTIVLARDGEPLEVSETTLHERTLTLKQQTRLDLRPLQKRLQASALLADGCLRL